MCPETDLTKYDRLATLLSRLLPDEPPIKALAVVGEGFRSIAVETDGGILVRVGKSEEAAVGFDLENRVLPFINRSLAAPVPSPLWHIPPCDELPYGALGYMKLQGTNPKPGDPTLRQSFIPELAHFLVELHAIPVESALEVGIRPVNPHQRILGARPVVMPMLADYLNQSEFARVDRWWEDLASDSRMLAYRPSVCHHDLWYENLLVDLSGHLSGVLDWSHVEIGDPAHDFAAIHHFGEELTVRFVEEYRAAGGTITDDDSHRIRRYWEGRELGALAWAIENDDEIAKMDFIHKLLEGPIFNQ